MNDFYAIPHSRECITSHMGVWLCRPEKVQSTAAMFIAGKLPTVSHEEFAAIRDRGYAPSYAVTPSGVAVIAVSGVMQKSYSKFEGVSSTVKARNDLRHALKNPDVKGILLSFDGVPGGNADGTKEFGDLVRFARRSKPVRCAVTDDCCSAGYWVASQCEKITVNPTGQVGCIGVYAAVYDLSGQTENEGVKVHVVSTGGVKGKGFPGTAIDDEYLGMVQHNIDVLNDFFIDAVTAGRNMDRAAVAALATGHSWFAAEALKNGLADAVGSFDDALSDFEDFLNPSTPSITNNQEAPAMSEARNTPETSAAETPPAAVAAAANPEPAADPVAAFTAMADQYGYDFAKTHFGKSETEVLAAALADKDAALKERDNQLAKLQETAGADPVPFTPVIKNDKQPMYDKNGKLIRK